MTVGTHDLGRHCESLGNPDHLDRDIDAQAIGKSQHLFLPVRVAGVDGVGRVGVLRPDQPRSHHGGESHRAGADHCEDIPRLHLPVLHTDLEAGGKDVGEQDALGV